MKKLFAMAAAAALVVLTSCSGGKFNPAKDPEGAAKYLIGLAEDSIPTQNTELLGTLPSLNEQYNLVKHLASDSAQAFFQKYYRERIMKEMNIPEEKVDSVVMEYAWMMMVHEHNTSRMTEEEKRIMDLTPDNHPITKIIKGAKSDPDSFYKLVDSTFMVKIDKEFERIDSIVPVDFQKPDFQTAKGVITKDLTLKIYVTLSPEWESKLAKKYYSESYVYLYGLDKNGDIIDEISTDSRLKRESINKNEWIIYKPFLCVKPEVTKLMISTEPKSLKGETLADKVDWGWYKYDKDEAFVECTCEVYPATGKGVIRFKPHPSEDHGGTFPIYVWIDPNSEGGGPLEKEDGNSYWQARKNNKSGYYELEFKVPAQYRRGKHTVGLVSGRYA